MGTATQNMLHACTLRACTLTCGMAMASPMTSLGVAMASPMCDRVPSFIGLRFVLVELEGTIP